MPSQRIASGEANGPQSSTCTVAASLPSPDTSAVSWICEPGAVSWALTCVATAGAPRTIVVSAASPHAVCVPATSALSAIDSRYV